VSITAAGDDPATVSVDDDHQDAGQCTDHWECVLALLSGT
jgi:hypothetical protein